MMLNVLAALTVKGDAVVAPPPALAATVMGPVTAPEGITTLTDEAEMLCSGSPMEAPFRPGMLTCGAAPKFLPLIVTIAPTVPDCGAKLVIVGPALETVNPVVSVAVCTPVATVTARGPSDAVASITSCVPALVALDTVTGPPTPWAAPQTEIPAPKLTTVAPCTRLVKAPVTETVSVWPGLPDGGATERI